MTERIAFKLENGKPGTALILIADLADRRKLVACANADEENDAPVNMVVEKLFAFVCQRHGFDKANVVWVEYMGYEVRSRRRQWEAGSLSRGRPDPGGRQAGKR